MDIIKLTYLVLIVVYLLIINIVGYWSMAADKKRAIKGEWRISENALLAICLVGGGIGSFSGMHIKRHKTKHKKFTIGVPILLVISYLGIGFLTYIILAL